MGTNYFKIHKPECAKRVDCPICAYSYTKDDVHQCPLQCLTCGEYCTAGRNYSAQDKLDYHNENCKQCPDCQQSFIVEDGHTCATTRLITVPSRYEETLQA